MRFVILLLLLAVPVVAAPVAMPDPGVLDQTRLLNCGTVEAPVFVELRFYDYTPPDEKYFKSLGIGLPKEKNFVQIMWAPEHAQANAQDTKVYFDGNVDGVVNEVLTFEEAAKRYPGSWCDVYEQVRKKPRA